MVYPTIEEAKVASHLKVCAWWRYLPSPGESAIGKNNFYEVLEKEAAVMDVIAERLKELGGFTPEISKRIGWE